MTENEKSAFRKLRRKYGILAKSLIVAIVLVAIKALIEQNGFAFITLNNLITAFLGGVFFTIGVLFSGAAADYKESEKLPGELAATLKTLYNDAKIIPMQPKDQKVINDLQTHIQTILYTINDNFRRNVWKLKEIDSAISRANDDITELGKKGAAPNFMIKLRSELSVVDRIAHRIDTITETSFIPAAYAIVELSIGSILLILMLTKIELPSGGILLFSLISMVLLSLMFLIRDMDNPFEVGKGSFADVNLDILFSLEEYWRDKGK